MIALTGATGQLGHYVLQDLLKTVPASQIVAIVRNPAKAQALSQQGVVVRQAEYGDEAALTAALQGVDKLLLISSSEVGQRAVQHRNVINAAKAAGVTFIAYTSLLHADTSPLGLAAEHIETEQMLADSGIAYALLRNGWYTENYLASAPPALEHGVFIGAAGEGYQPKALVQLARTICRVLAVFHGWHYRSKLVARLSFLGYNKGLEGRTAHDWLNRDPVEVDRYRADERCTFIFTLNAYYSMFSGILRLYDPALLARVPKDLPLLFLAGDADPVGEQGAGVKRAVKSLLDAGVKNIEVKLYPSARHELLVELNREEVFADIGDWLERRL